jgi:hypothetical protein
MRPFCVTRSRPERIVSIFQELQKENLLSQCSLRTNLVASEDDILLVHLQEVHIRSAVS